MTALILGIVAGLVVVAIVFIVTGPLRRLLRGLYLKLFRRVLYKYLRWVKDSAEKRAFLDVIEGLFLRINLNYYVEPTLLLDEEKGHKRAVPYLMERCRSSPDLRIAVRGMFGSGKSTLCLKLWYELAKEYLADWKSLPVPIYVPLRRGVADGRSETKSQLDLLFSKKLRDYGLSPDNMRAFLRKHRVLLLLDGLDQMDVSRNPYVSAEILHHIQLCLEGTQTRVVLTMRSDYFEGNRVLRQALARGKLDFGPGANAVHIPPFEVCHLQEFSDDQIREYLRKHEIVNSTDFQTVYDAIFANVHLPRLLKNPLLLCMFLSLPENVRLFLGSGGLDVGEIYKHYVDHWIDNDGYLTELPSGDQRISFVHDLAISLLMHGADGGITLDKVKDIEGQHDWMPYRDGLTDMQGRYYHNTTSRSFLLVNRDRSLMFVHTSLKEYFCANWAVYRLRSKKDIPADILERLYSNLIIWFMRSAIEPDDYKWIPSMLDSKKTVERRLGYALLTGLGPSRKSEVRALLEGSWDKEKDIEAKRHILYGIGWAGGEPWEKKYQDFIEANLRAWSDAPILYYYSTRDGMREHCRARLRAFRARDYEYYGARCLYFRDLGQVGEPSDIELIKPYAEAGKESTEAVRVIVNEAIKQIEARCGTQGQDGGS